jgi:hypothetical protein
MNRNRVLVGSLVGLALLGLLLGSAGVALAQAEEPLEGNGLRYERRVLVYGRVTEINGRVLTLMLRSGRDLDLATDENTLFLVPGIKGARAEDLNGGETVAVQGIRIQGEERFYASAVVVLRGGDGTWQVRIGRLTEIEGTTLHLVSLGGKTFQLVTDADTQFFGPRLDQNTLEELEIGRSIGAQVIERADGSLYASAVGQGLLPARPRAGTVRGQISAIAPGSFMLTTGRGPVAVLVDARTRFLLPGVVEPGLDDLAIGQKIGAAGHWEPNGVMHARLVGGGRARLSPLSP